MRRILPYLFVFVMCLPISATARDGIKLSSDDLRDMFFTTHKMSSGILTDNKLAWLESTYPSGLVEVMATEGLKQYFWKGHLRIVGDEVCVVWEGHYSGVPQCNEIYRVEQNKYELWRGTMKRGWFVFLN
jgi:hypothetical protein